MLPIKNLTPHTVTLLDSAGNPWMTFQPEPVSARVEETPAPLGWVPGNEFPVREAPTYGEVTGLPETDDSRPVYYLVSTMVLDALRRQGCQRRDVLGISWPDVVRHEDGPQKGQPRGTKAFVHL